MEDRCIAEGAEGLIEQVEHLTRVTVAVEQRFASLVRLECRIDTLWIDDGPRGKNALALGVARCIREAKKLEWLSIAFGDDVHPCPKPAE